MSINIVSTYTADVMRPFLEPLLKFFSTEETIFIYNQIFEQLIFPESSCNTNQSGLNILLLRIADLVDGEIKITQQKESLIKIDEIISLLQSNKHQTSVPFLIAITPSNSTSPEQAKFYEFAEKHILDHLKEIKNVFLIDSNEIKKKSHLLQDIYNSFTDIYGHIPYTIDFYHNLAIIIARQYSLMSRKPYKVIVLDCDGTLWDGIIEEDGIEGIFVDSYYQAIQQFFITCFEKGFLICLCSKNSEASVLSVFKEKKEMILNIEKHICAHRINWFSKSENIKDMARELDLGLDSFIFVDDNPVECAQVKAQIPSILAVDLPQNKKERLAYLNNIWAFDMLTASPKKVNRTEFYKKNKLRTQLQSESHSFSDFLEKLKISSDISKATLKDFERINELNQRTNQFNLDPQSLNHVELYNSISTDYPICMKIEVSDRFMDYGLVGVLIYEIFDDYLLVKSFFLSCRILSRGIELEVLKHLKEVAEIHDIKTLRFSFSITERNIPAITFLKKINFSKKLNNKDSIVSLSIEQIDNLSPVFFAETNVSKKKNVGISVAPKDYFLNIAQKVLEDQCSFENRARNDEDLGLESVKINLLEILKRNNINVEQKDIPLIFLGLNSLQSVVISGVIFKTYNVEIKPQELIYKELTIEKLINQVLAKIKNPHDTAKSIHFNCNKLPLSSSQLRLWYDEELSDIPSARNNMFIAYQIKDSVDVTCLNKSIKRIIEKHDVFRYRFYEDNDEPFIKIASSSDIPLNVESVELAESNIYEYIDRVKKTPFDLKNDGLLKVIIINPNSNKPILLISIHHIVHDGWSLNLLLEDLSFYYTAYSSNKGEHFNNDDQYHYAHYIAHEQQYRTKLVLAEQKAFWERYLQKLPILELVCDHLKNENLSQNCARITFQINKSISKKLKTIASYHHVTLFDLLSSAFSLFLSHLSHQEDIHFVTASSGRNSGYFARTIGFFVNLLIIRLHVTPDKSFAELIKEHKKNIECAFAHQDLPFNEILRTTGENANSKTHFFSQAGFIFQNYPIHNFTINNANCKRVYSVDKAHLIYDDCEECRFGNLVCFMQEQKDSLQGMFEYNTSLYHKNTIKFFINSFKELLKSISIDQNSSAMSLSLLDSRQKNLILNKWNHDVLPYPPGVNLISEFENQVKLYPNAIAVKDQELQWTYSQIDELSNHIANELITQGISKETYIGVLIDKSCEQLIAVLGILKASGCYIPLDKRLPHQRLSYIINDSQLKLILVQDKEPIKLPKSIQSMVKTIPVSSKLNTTNHPNLSLPNQIYPNQLACIFYTSGSTGTPKGVMIEHSGIVRLVKETNYIEIAQTDRVALTSSFLFDASTFEIWGALLNGAMLVIPPENVLLDKKSLQQFIRNHKISVLFLTTQLFHTYAMLGPEIFKQLKYLLVGGDAVLSDAVENIFKQPNHPKLFINGYGPTENTTFSTTFSIKNKKQIHNPIPIGKPIRGTKVYILGKNYNLLPINAPGKLYVAGVGLARQYLNKEELTHQRFIHLFNERLYDTGDIVAWQNDGNIRYLGREDNQIKINGYRIELSEIETVLDMHESVEQAVVLVKFINHSKRIVAFIVLKEDISLQNVNLHHHLLLNLPSYMMPHAFYQVESMPLTNNGKVDKNLLLQLNLEAISYTEFEPPSTYIETKLCNIFSEILHIPNNKISINAEFFELGGNSILALNLIHFISNEFNVNLTFTTLFESSTIKLLAIKIEEFFNKKSNNLQGKPIEEVIKVVKKGDEEKVPIIFVHPIGGTGFCYLDLIRLLPQEQPCYLIQDPSIDADKIMFENIAEMAGYYNTLLKSHFQDTQIILAGFSFGGMLSLEMINQLMNQGLGNMIKCLIAFDTWIVSRLLNKHAKSALKASIMNQYYQVADNLKRQNIDPRPWMEIYYKRLQELGFNYLPPKVEKKILLFKALEQKEEFSAMFDETNYLNLHTTEIVEVHKVPGCHNTILQKPNVQKISEIIKNHPLLVNDDK